MELSADIVLFLFNMISHNNLYYIDIQIMTENESTFELFVC